MMETSTSVNNLNYSQHKQEKLPADDAEGLDSAFYDHIKPQLNALKRNPSDETITRILAYSKTK